MDVEYKGKDGQLPLVIIGLGDDFKEAAKFGLELLDNDFDKVVFLSDFEGNGHHTKLHTLRAEDIDDEKKSPVDDIAYLLHLAAYGNQPS